MNLLSHIASLPEVGGLLLVAGGFIFIARLFRRIFAPSVEIVAGAELSQPNSNTQEEVRN